MNEMHRGENHPYRTYLVGGKSFPIYLCFDEQMKESYPLYPDFEKNPEFTDDGRPFATAEQEICSNGRPREAEGPLPGDCGGCGWFYREKSAYDPIGICMCDQRRKSLEEIK